MIKNIINPIHFGFLLALIVVLTACQRQEQAGSSASRSAVIPPSPSVQASPIAVSPYVVESVSVDTPAVKDLLNRIVRPDLPGMTFEQVKVLFPETCIGNDDDRSISCPGIGGLISISYAGGPDGALDMVFSGGTASCNTLKLLINPKFGRGEDVSDKDNDGACGMQWWEINPNKKTYHAHLRKLKGDDHVTFQIGSEDTVGP